MDMEFASKLRRLIAERGTSQRQLAELLTCAGMETSKSHVSNWCKKGGEYVPDLRRARWIADHFGVSLEYLGREDLTEPCYATISEDERRLLQNFRASGLSWRKAAQLLLAEERPTPVFSPPDTEPAAPARPKRRKRQS